MKTYSDIYLLLLKRMKTLLEVRMFFERAEYRSVLSNTIREYFPMLQWLKKEIGAGEDVLRLFEVYKKKYGVWETIPLKEEDYSKYEIVDLEDEINYLKVCVKNTCKVDLDNTEELLNGIMEDLDPQERRDWNRMRNHPIVYDNPLLNVEKGLVGGQAYGGMIQKINSKDSLRKKIVSGEIYIYKTKPKCNLIINCVLLGLWLLGMIFLIVSLVYTIVMVVTGGSIGEGSQTKFVISQLFFLPFFSLNIFSLCKRYKNENYRFSFSKTVFQVNTISLFIFLLFGVLVGYKDNNSSIIPVSQMAIIASVVIAVIGTSIYLFSFLYFQPKTDKELIDKHNEEYFSEESKETLPTEI